MNSVWYLSMNITVKTWGIDCLIWCLNLVQIKQMLKRQGQSSKITSEQMQRKLAENGISKDDLSKNIPVK